MPAKATDGQAWRSLEAWGFPAYEINRQAQIRTIGSDTIRSAGALNLVNAEGVKCFRSAGKLCRLAFGVDAKGASVPRTKLTAADVIEIRRIVDAPTIVAARFGVSPSTIKAVRAGRIWTSVRQRPRARYQTDSDVFRAA